jgi:hypothetical protein
VEFEPGSGTTLLDMAQIEIELAELLGGRKADVRTAEDLSRYFRDEVVRLRSRSMSPDDRWRIGHMIEAAERRDDAGTPTPSPGEVTHR